MNMDPEIRRTVRRRLARRYAFWAVAAVCLASLPYSAAMGYEGRQRDVANAMEECITLGAAAYYSARRDRATEAREARLTEQPGLEAGIAGLHRLSSAQAASSAMELESIGREPGPRLTRFCAARNPPPPLLGL